jgi:hypothetical protein
VTASATGDEVVFYFDVLGFRARAAGDASAAVDALTALAAVLGAPPIANLTGRWAHRYSLSDSVFLTHPDPLAAVTQAATLVFTLVHHGASADDPVLVRGALASGPVTHLRGIFLTAPEPANLVGEGVLDAVRLEQSGLAGPRVLVAERLARVVAARAAAVARWLLRPTSAPGVWEILWPLPARPEDLAGEALSLQDVAGLALRLLRRHGGAPGHGRHYRALFLLVLWSLERAARHVRQGAASLDLPVRDLLPVAEVLDVCHTTSGLPRGFIREVRETLEAVQDA